MAINRFNQLQAPAKFNPLSFQEMAFAPMVLREREDTLLNQQDELLNQMNNIKVPDLYQEEFNNMKNEYTMDIENLSKKINQEGAGNLNILGEFRNLRNKYNKDVSSSGSIGKAAEAQSTIDGVREQFYKIGLEQGYNPQVVNARWEEELAKYKQGLPNSLKDFKGNVPEFNPNYAPNNIDMASELQKLSGLVKSSSESVGDFEFVPNYDPQDPSKVINYTVVNSKGDTIKNNEQVDALKAYMEDRVLNPNSELNQVLNFKGIKPEEYLNQVDQLTKAMRSTKTSAVRGYAGQTPISPTARANASSKSSSTSSNSGATLLRQDTNGMNQLKTSYSSKAIKATIEDIQRDPELTQEEKNNQITAYNHALVRKEQLEKDPNFIKDINNAIAENTRLQNHGITNYEEYKAYINDPKNQEEVVIPADPSMGDYAPQTFESNADSVEAIFQDSFTSLQKNYLAPSNYYTLGVSTADTKLQKMMSEGVKNLDLRALASENILSIRNNDNEFNKIGPTTNDEEYEAFTTAMENASNVKYSLKGIDDGGVAGDASLVYGVTAKVGKDNVNYTMSIDMKNNDLSKQLLNPASEMYQSLDRPSQLVLDQIRDNKLNYRGLATNVSTDSAFTKGASESVKYYSNIANNELGITPRSKDDKVNDYLFVKPDDSNYSVIINGDNSYSTYKKDADGNTSYMTIGDLGKKFMASDYLSEYPTSNIGALDKDASFQERYKGTFMHKLMLNTFNIDNPQQGAAYYSNNAQYNKLLKEYYQSWQNQDPDLYDKAVRTYDQIQGMQLQSKNIKHVL